MGFIRSFLKDNVNVSLKTKLYVSGVSRLLLGENLYSLGKAIDFLAQYIHLKVKSTIRSLPSKERNITYLVGRHRVKVIGVDGREVFFSLWNFRDARQVNRVYILRRHTIVFYHPEHKTVDFEVPPSIIRLETLRSGVLGHTLVLPFYASRYINSLCEDFVSVKLIVLGNREEDRLAISWPYSESRVGVLPTELKSVFVIKDCFILKNKLIGARFIVKDYSFDTVDSEKLLGADYIILVGSGEEEIKDGLSKIPEKMRERCIVVVPDYGNQCIYGGEGLEKIPHFVIDPFDAMSRRAVFRYIFMEHLSKNSLLSEQSTFFRS